MFMVGSTWYFLYVPGNQVMMVVPAIYLMGSAALVALRVTGDFARTVVAVCLAVLPTSARFFIEGLQGDLLLVLLGMDDAGIAKPVVASSLRSARIGRARRGAVDIHLKFVMRIGAGMTNVTFTRRPLVCRFKVQP